MTLISRKEAIEAVCDKCPVSFKAKCEWRNNGHCSTKAALEALPSTDAKTKCVARIEVDTEEIVRRIKEEYDITYGWIPCSERLPKNNDWVIVTILDECGDTPYRYTDFGWYLEAANCWIVGVEQRTDVTAWMPLPIPYREDNER